ncbi:unnamed protein product [Phyllotreta striolata]|uniref:Uncharacterized protein n=1 Tax=Phyllotreta striolata TaxID=444603 RepID=A0A9N9TF06_PHYSR|nr:unnamed protein product [Phyllotreta striolata]
MVEDGQDTEKPNDTARRLAVEVDVKRIFKCQVGTFSNDKYGNCDRFRGQESHRVRSDLLMDYIKNPVKSYVGKTALYLYMLRIKLDILTHR